MEPMDTMNRKKEFKQPKAQKVTIQDSRFGIRRMFLNSQERPRIAQYRNAGRGPNGEHQN
jgi:hypothetical protein